MLNEMIDELSHEEALGLLHELAEGLNIKPERRTSVNLKSSLDTVRNLLGKDLKRRRFAVFGYNASSEFLSFGFQDYMGSFASDRLAEDFVLGLSPDVYSNAHIVDITTMKEVSSFYASFTSRVDVDTVNVWGKYVTKEDNSNDE